MHVPDFGFPNKVPEPSDAELEEFDRIIRQAYENPPQEPTTAELEEAKANSLFSKHIATSRAFALSSFATKEITSSELQHFLHCRSCLKNIVQFASVSNRPGGIAGFRQDINARIQELIAKN